jgi:uncharacterized membrane protein YgcG
MLLFLSLFIALGSNPTLAKNLPPAPKGHIFDEPRALNPLMKQTLDNLLEEQWQTGGGYIVLAIFQSLEREDPEKWTRELLNKWELGEKKVSNRVILALFWEEKEGALIAGTELDGLLNEDESDRIVSHFLLPEVGINQPDRALSLSVLEILRTLESPMVQSGRATQLIQDGGFTGEWTPVPSAMQSYGWAWVVLAGGLFSGLVLYLLVSAEAHFTAQGWYRPKISSYFILSKIRRSDYEGSHGSW